MLARSINLPAHTFYPSRYTIANILRHEQRLVFFCSSSRGRGPRCARWMKQTFEEIDCKTEVLVLEGGAKAFTALYGDQDQLVYRLPADVTE